GTAGQLTLLSGTAATSVALRIPPDPHSVNRELRRGMWLEGFEEREKGILAGWVEAGGPVIGIRIALDGRLRVGWGKPTDSDDLHPADPPQPPYTPLKVPPTIIFSCEFGQSVT